MAAAVDENEIDFFILKPKRNKLLLKNKEIFGQILRVRDKKIYLEIFPETADLVRKSYMHEDYDIHFTLNRVPYQLQHNALEFLQKEKLFKILINHTSYRAKNPQKTDAKNEKAELQ